MWMTPSVSNSQGNAYTRDRGEVGAERLTLTGQAQAWPTPTSSDGGANSNRDARGNVGANLQERAQQWPTQTAQDSEQAGGRGTIERGKRGESLNSMATSLWPTPASRDYRSPNAASYEERGGGSKGEQLQNFVAHHFSLLPDHPTPSGPESLPSRRTSRLRLNPIFGEWLMGWRLQWTKPEPHASSASETVLWRSRLQSHLSCLLSEQAGAERLVA